MISKLESLRLILQQIADDSKFSELGEDIQDSIEDLTFNIPMQLTLLKDKYCDDNVNCTAWWDFK